MSSLRHSSDDTSSSRPVWWPLMGLAAIMTVLAIAFLDRGWSSWAHATLPSWKPVFIWMTRPAEIAAPLGALYLFLAALAAASGRWQPGRMGWALIAASLAALVAVPVKDELKYLFGRPWPETWIDNNPSWIGNGLFGFFPLHGGRGWASFPSGHTTMITAPMAALRDRLPELRWLWLLPIACVAIGLLGADFHFISDVTAGLLTGITCGVGLSAVIRPSERP
ncbi:phosphatase PAP2 family protein [Granulibacter bethesdensis]|uniref:Phosphoesterase, PAP2 family n=1 Tax=Granulibacter bethesdensis (strain ATCC BAA-1260 / CGDNIH1) TaxID=391165 RepID=Q0BPY0_GRABC|nr:phosphatase PAP2 family protein [Granulibacter bethesdensis]ABI63122.1 Phosphoesterase, PAP2 family [Granulibacter bethesdensis CGDNIH1]APH52997.1 Phosphoesterase, PAP2 family [Granulibacter bethesdensis]APH65686.1 Phosphoesterase, PAP2 family [Granulibacter bethesdensis]